MLNKISEGDTVHEARKKAMKIEIIFYLPNFRSLPLPLHLSIAPEKGQRLPRNLLLMSLVKKGFKRLSEKAPNGRDFGASMDNMAATLPVRVIDLTVLHVSTSYPATFWGMGLIFSQKSIE